LHLALASAYTDPLIDSRTMTPALSPEQQLCAVLALGTFPPSLQRQAIRLLEGPLQWQLLQEQIVAHEVVPVAFRNLASLGFPHVPIPIRQDLETRYRMNVLHNTILVQELCAVLRVLHEAGVTVIPWKGPTLAQDLYGDASLRVCSDLDILVPRADVWRAFAVLRSSGYQAEFEGAFFENLFLRSNIHYQLWRWDRQFGHLIELHWGVLWGGNLEYNLDDLWRDARPVTVFGAPALRLSPEWEFLLLATHAARHQWSALKWLVDIHEACRRGDIDWERVEEEARRRRWQRVVEGTLAICHALFQMDLPAGFSRSTIPAGLKLMRSDPTTSSDWHQALIMPRLLPAAGDRLRYVLRRLLIPTLEDWRFVRLPSFLGSLYYAIRPLRLVGKWSSAIIRAATRSLTCFLKGVDPSHVPEVKVLREGEGQYL
jgi:hypothetical protein